MLRFFYILIVLHDTTSKQFAWHYDWDIHTEEEDMNLSQLFLYYGWRMGSLKSGHQSGIHLTENERKRKWMNEGLESSENKLNIDEFRLLVCITCHYWD